jgi:hypothetical protein
MGEGHTLGTTVRCVPTDAVDYVLADAEQRNREHPRTFFIPTRAEREALRPGDSAKLLFELLAPGPTMPGGERMWVEVTEVVPAGFVGVLENQPSAITTIQRGDTLRFGPEHVIALVDPWPLLEKKIIVTRRSHELDVRPRHVYRQDPNDERDSGWTALIGDETDEEVNDPSQLLAQSLGFLLDRWPEMRPVFESDPINAEWVWNEGDQRYEVVDPAAIGAPPAQEGRRRWWSKRR